MSSLSPSPDKRNTHNLRDKTNSPQKPHDKYHDQHNASLIQGRYSQRFFLKTKKSLALPSIEAQRDPRHANNYSVNDDRQTSNVYN